MVRVLFIDDDVQAHKTLAFALPRNFELSSAFTGADGLLKLSEERPDVVLLDIGLPDSDGITVLGKIQGRPCAPPVIMLTALQEIRLVKEAIQAGARDYIVKPVGRKLILAKLRKVRGVRD